MLKVIHYDAIEKKNILEGRMVKSLTPTESLVHCLDLLDFMAAFRSVREPEVDEIDWIVLEIKKHDQ